MQRSSGTDGYHFHRSSATENIRKTTSFLVFRRGPCYCTAHGGDANFLYCYCVWRLGDYVWLFNQRVCRLQGVRGGERELGLVVSSISKRPVCRRVGGRVESTVVSNRLATNRTLPSLHGLTGRLHIDILAIAETCGRLTSRKLIRGIRNGNAFIVRQNGRLVGRHTHRHVVSGLHRISVRTGTTSVDLLSLLNVFRGTCERRS